jgi:hypothetical protein
MIETLRDIALDKSQPGAVRIAAAAIVLDHGCGRVKPVRTTKSATTTARSIGGTQQVFGSKTDDGEPRARGRSSYRRAG